MPTETQVDVVIENHGTLVIFQPLTPSASEWIEEHVEEKATWLGSGLVVEHRYAEALASGMKDDGLVVQ